MDLPTARVEALLKMARQPVSLDAPVGEDGDVSVGISSKTKAQPILPTDQPQFAQGEIGTCFHQSLGTRAQDSRDALWPDDGWSHTLEEIGNLYNVRGNESPDRSQSVAQTAHPTELTICWVSSRSKTRPLRNSGIRHSLMREAR